MKVDMRLLVLLTGLCILCGMFVDSSGLVALLLFPVAVVWLTVRYIWLAYTFLRGKGAPARRSLLTAAVPALLAMATFGAANIITPVPAVPADAESASVQLRHMHRTDQSDRRSGRFILDTMRDAARLERTLDLDRKQLISSAEGRYHAALILQHGSTPAHFRRAFEFSAAAASEGFPGAEQLRRAACDRWLLSLGKSQLYGTQLLVVQ